MGRNLVHISSRLEKMRSFLFISYILFHIFHTVLCFVWVLQYGFIRCIIMIFIIMWSLHLTYHYLTLFSLKNFPLSLAVSQYDHIFIIVISVVRRIGGEGKHPWCPGEQGCLQRRSSPLQHNHRYHHVTLASPSPTCSCLLLMDSSQPLSRLYHIKVGK